jgi:chemotaxis methyl-accepting protein methylase
MILDAFHDASAPKKCEIIFARALNYYLDKDVNHAVGVIRRLTALHSGFLQTGPRETALAVGTVWVRIQ